VLLVKTDKPFEAEDIFKNRLTDSGLEKPFIAVFHQGKEDFNNYNNLQTICSG